MSDPPLAEAAQAPRPEVDGVILIGGETGPGNQVGIDLCTRRKWPIPNEQKQREAPASVRRKNMAIINRFPTIDPRSEDGAYNCVGMVFACRRTWIDTEHVDKILDDDGYRRVSNRNDVVAGDVVVYRYSDGVVAHVGIVLEVGTVGDTRIPMLLSKWGEWGEFRHQETQITETMGSNWEYYTERENPCSLLIA